MKNTQIKKLLRDERGLSTMEYAVLFVIIVVGALALWSNLGRSLQTQITNGQQTFNSELSGFNPGQGQGQGQQPPQH